MFPNRTELRDYDFLKTDNYQKWKGTFATSLGKVLEQVHPSLKAAEEALMYVEDLILTLMGKLCAKPCPHTIQDVEERVGKTFPNPIDRWALNDARESTDKTKKKKPVLPLDKIHQMLQKEVFAYKIDTMVTSFIVAIVEYIAADILKLAGNYVKKISNNGALLAISSQDIKTSMNADKALMEMFYHEQVLRREKAEEEAALARPLEPSRTPRASLTYEELVRDLMSDEKQYLRDLHMIIRVFKEEIEKIVPKDSKDVELIFGNIVEIYELTVTLLGSLEDTVESASETQMPHIGICFEELAEAVEFDVYIKYAQIVTTQESREALQSIVDDPELSERLDTAGHGFRLAAKYFLPKLLASPITHAFLYFDYVAMLLKLAPCTEDMESFQQVEGLMRPIQKALVLALGNAPKIEAASRMASRARRQVALEKTNELARLIDNWDNKDIGQCCNEFIREDNLGKVGPGKKVTERRGFLFDGLLLLCKPCAGDKTKSELKLKERLYIRKLDIIDRPDTDELKNCMELSPKCGTSVVLCCCGAIDKNRWMADLVMLNTKNMLDRALDSILLDLEKKHPLKLPPPSLYRFAVEDSEENIVLEGKQNSTVPLIRGATLLKLVERLTYHIYADPMFVRTFLTTYRSFCKPPELLDLLIERFNIPDPSLVYDAPEKAETDTEKLSKNSSREDFKRYRKEFLQPVQFRVLNVLRHWVDQHYYDFEKDPSLLEKLRAFLDSITGKPMKKWVESVIKIVQRRSGIYDGDKSATSPPAPSSLEGGPLLPALPLATPAPVFDRIPPPLEWKPSLYAPFCDHLLALHPIELARQLTLLEFDMYRAVKPSELVGAAWTKKDKETSSPNLLRITRHTTNFTRWIEKSIVDSMNLEERTAVLCRAVEVMMVLRELNNFNGVLAMVSAMASASVYRLNFTFQMLPARLERALEECRDLNMGHLRKYQEKLRSINPPCVPFFGMYLTNIMHIEDGNKDFLPNSENLINFSKRRMVAEIIGEIQQYQNQPYCLTVEPKLRAFLENLNAFPGLDAEDTKIRDYLYNKSMMIEPRKAKQAVRFPRDWPELSLKSPGIKPARSRHHASSSAFTPTLPDTADDHSSTLQLSPTSSTWDGTSISSFGSTVSLQQVGADDDTSPRPLAPRGKLAMVCYYNRHSNASSTSGLGDMSCRLPTASITELSSRLLDNFSNAPPPVSPRPSSTLPHAAPAQRPPPPPRGGNVPSPDHQMVEFRTPNGPDWAAGPWGTEDRPPAVEPVDSASTETAARDDHLHRIAEEPANSTWPYAPRHDTEVFWAVRPPALSPRHPIVDADVFPKSAGSLFDYPPCGGKPPALSPRNCNPQPRRPSIVDETGLGRSRLEVDRTTKPALKTNGDILDGDGEPPSVAPRTSRVISSRESESSSLSNDVTEDTIKPPPPPERPPALSPRTGIIPAPQVDPSRTLKNKRTPTLSGSSTAGNISTADPVAGHPDSHSGRQCSIDGDALVRSTHSEPSPKNFSTGDVFSHYGRYAETSPKPLPMLVSNELYNQPPPLSPHVNVPNSVQNYERHHGVNVAAFSFPSLGTGSSVSPSCPPVARPSPTATHSVVPHTPPPLPPRRRRDSIPTPPAPNPPQPSPTMHTHSTTLTQCGVPAVPPRSTSPPPPLPPRPQPQPPLLRLAQSTILQRRHQHNNFSGENGNKTPRLPPKPPPSTVFHSPSVTHARQETQ